MQTPYHGMIRQASGAESIPWPYVTTENSPEAAGGASPYGKNPGHHGRDFLYMFLM